MTSRSPNNMRISGGAARGLRLKGAVAAGIRPTTERVRSAIFNILQDDQFVDRRVLDLFAGTGSLGLEALSRGAAHADFVERNRRQCQVLQDNLQSTGYTDVAHVHCSEVGTWLKRMPDPADDRRFALVLLDPPYRMGDPSAILEDLAAGNMLEDDATVVLGHSNRISVPSNIGRLQQYDRRNYGDNALAFYVRSENL